MDSDLPYNIDDTEDNVEEFTKGQSVLILTYFPSQLRTDRDNLPGALVTWEGPFEVLSRVDPRSPSESPQYKIDISLGPSGKPWLAIFPASRLRLFTGTRRATEHKREVIPSLRYRNGGGARKVLETIVAEMKQGKGVYYLVRWEGWGVEGMEWKTRSEVGMKMGKRGKEMLRWWDSVMKEEPGDSDEA